MKQESTKDELNTYDFIYKIWRFLVRFITPVAVIIVFLNAIGIISL
jgi:NSS family neurotransmitter:Na+ symporter